MMQFIQFKTEIYNFLSLYLFLLFTSKRPLNFWHSKKMYKNYMKYFKVHLQSGNEQTFHARDK